MQRERAVVTHHARFNFMREARIWYSRDPNQALLPGGFENEIVLSDEFFREVTTHSIPTDLEAAKALSCAPAALDLFMWLSYRCFTARSQERIPIFGDFGLAAQLGSADYASCACQVLQFGVGQTGPLKPEGGQGEGGI
jgi:Plasmid encoded RepA protein